MTTTRTLIPAPRAAGAAVDVPVEPDRDEARRAARAELSDPVYREAEPSLVRRVTDWIGARLGELASALTDATPGGIAGVVLALVLLVALVAAVRARVGPTTRARGRRATGVFGPEVRTADQHRDAARRAAGEGGYDTAVREYVRAVVRGLEETGVLDPRPGRTAHEAAREAGARLPTLAGDLRAAAVLFDEVHYGGRRPGPRDVDTVASLDTAVRATRRAPV